LKRNRTAATLALSATLAMFAVLALAPWRPVLSDDRKPGDVQKAKKPFPKVEILFNTNESHKQIAEALAEMWKNDLHVNVSLANTEWKVYLDLQDQHKYDLARAGWVFDYNDPFNIFECWKTGNGNNRTGWSSPKYDELVDKAMLESDNTKRWGVFQEAERLVVDECPILPIYTYVNKNMIDLARVKGWYDNVLNLHPYDALWIEDGGAVAPPEKQKLVFNNGAEPQTLDPALMSGVPEHRIAMALFEGLTRFDPKDLHPLPGVAEKWEISEDGRTYTFHLRENARWSNGDPVTAEDFAWSWMRVIDPRALPQTAEYAQTYDWIEGAKTLIHMDPPKEKDGASKEAYDKALDEARAKVAISAKDARTLVVRLAKPCPFFLNLCALETLMPVHRKTVEKFGVQWTRADKIVSNGPYVLKEWVPLSKIVFAPNKSYWDAPRVKLQEVDILPIDNQDTALNKFLAGEVDWIDDVPINRADEVKKHPNFRVSPFLTIYFYRFNCTKPPFDDVRVRQAFSMCVNKKTICTKVQRFGELPLNGIVPQGCGNPPYKSVKGLPYDPAAARKLLQDAGYAVD
jgi:oligopeptide transport system substrate-binding protein